jgi:NADH dehydrogenase [ubiquinone] 1 alpha subcomplex assembly factor 5
LSPLARRRTSAAVTGLFDQRLRAMRLERALRRGPELFLHERSYEDILDRLSLIRRRFEKALLIGRFEGAWRDRLLGFAQSVDVIDAGALLTVEPGAYDLCVAGSGLDTVEDLSNALLTIRFALGEDSLLIGAVPGGDTLPALRAAMRAADERMGAATAHVHPRIEPAGLTSLLTSAGFTMPVVDLDRVQVTYKSLGDLVRDLRAMGATNLLSARSRQPLSRSAVTAATEQFNAGAIDGRVTELFEILHFAAWTPSTTS